MMAVITIITSCSKNTEDGSGSGGGTNPTGSGQIYYHDSSRIYVSNDAGGNWKLLAGLDTSNRNSSINNFTSSVDGSKVYFIHQVSGLNPVKKLYVVNKDGSSLQSLTDVTGNAYINNLTATTDNKLSFISSEYLTPGSPLPTVKFEKLNVDGTGRTTVATLPNRNFYGAFSKSSNRYILGKSGFPNPDTLYVGGLDNMGVFSTTLTRVTTGVREGALSSDGSKVAFVKYVGNNLEVSSFNIGTSATTVVGTYTMPPALASMDRNLQVAWVAGGTKLILAVTGMPGFINTSTPTYCTLYTIGSSAAPASWITPRDKRLFTLFSD